MSCAQDMDALSPTETSLAFTCRLVSGVGLAMESLVSSGSAVDRLEAAVRCLGEHAGVARIGVYRFDSASASPINSPTLVCEWKRDRRSGGVLRAPLPDSNAEGNGAAVLVEEAGRDSAVDDASSPDDSRPNFCSVVATPMEADGRVLGFVRLDHFRQHFLWTEDDSKVLRGFTGFLAAYLTHSQSDDQPAAFSIEQLALLKEISFQLTESGNWSFLSPAWDYMTGIPATRSVGKHHSSYLFRYVGEGLDNAESLDITCGIAPGGTRSGEAQLLADDGSTVTVSYLITRTHSPQSGTSAYQGILTDIREQKEQERRDRETAIALESKNSQLLEALVAAREATRMKSEFLATMSHEIRTPLNGVIGMTTLMLGTSLDRKQREFAEAIRSSAESLLAIVNSILDFSRLEAQRVELEQVEFDARVLLDEVFASLAEPASRKRIDLVSQIRFPFPAKVVGDSGKIKQILTNLVGNAIKFSPRGEICVRMHWDFLVPPCGELHVRVVDKGIGIMPDTLHRLFRPFSQGEASTSRVYGGTGLGLAISKQLCDLMGGEIAVHSRIGHGSEFHLILRMVLRDSPEMKAPLEPWASILSGKRLLLANMGEFAERSWANALELAGIQAKTDRGMQDTIRTLAAEKPDECTDIVIFDTRGLEGNGAEINRQLRLASRHPDLVTVLLDSLHDPVDHSLLGVVAPVLVLRKPISPYHALAQLGGLVRTQDPAPRMPLRRTSETTPPVTGPRACAISFAANHERGKTLAFLLKRFGLQARTAESFQDLLRLAADERCSVVVLDAEASGEGRASAADRLRSRCGEMPPLVIGVAFTEAGQHLLRGTNGFDATLGVGFQRADFQGLLDRFAGQSMNRRASAS
ncbi:MAG: hypothetical protein KIT83_16175 [Bryobacterales bacterium]|nr:hypothetical protein [Bryobacterales bacterium]